MCLKNIKDLSLNRLRLGTKEFNTLEILSTPVYRTWFHSLIACTIVFGYIFCGRGFAGLHIPDTSIYIGEIILVMSCLYFLSDIFKRSLNKFQTILAIIIIFFLFLILKDLIFQRDQEFTSIIRDGATVYYFIFLFLFAGVTGYFFFQRIVTILIKYHFLIALSMLLHILFSPFLSSFLVIGNDFYGLFAMPDCMVPPFACLLIVILIEKSKGNGLNTLEYFSIGILLSVIILVQARGAILGSAVALGYYVLFLSRFRLRFLWFLLTGSFLISIPAIFFLPSLHDFQERLFVNSEYRIFHLYSQDMIRAKFRDLIDPKGDEYKGGTGEGRIYWWKAVIEDNKSSTKTMLFGQGFGQNLGVAINYGKENVRGAHNAWVNIFGWAGLTGVVLYASIFMKIFCFFYFARRHTDEDLRISSILACNTSIVFLLAVLITSMFDNSLSSPVIAIPLFIYLGSAVSMVMKEVYYAEFTDT